jgi:L-serine deaminase
VLQIVGYCGLILLEAVGVAASVSNESGGGATAALLVGLLGSVPTANHCAERLFVRFTQGSDWAHLG